MSRLAKGLVAAVGTLLLFFVLVVAIGAANKDAGPEAAGGAGDAVARILDELADAANARAGERVAENLIAAGASIEDGRRLTLRYRLVSGELQIDRQLVDEKVRLVQREACRDPHIRKVFERGAELRYAYHGEAGQALYLVEIDRAVCAALV